MSSLAEAGQPRRDTRERQVFTEQIRLLYANANVSVWVTVSVAAVFSYLQWRVISHRIVLGWLLYMLVISSARFVLARRYWRGVLIGTKTSAWGAAFTIGAGLAAAGWGSAGILLYPKAHLLNQVVLAFVVGGMMLGAASLLAARPEAFLTFIIPSGVPTAVRFLLHGDNLHFAMGLLGSIFTIATLIAAWRIYLTVGSSLNLRFEKGALVKDLQVARDRAEQALRDREQYLTLAQSTARLGVWDCDLRTNTIEISEECARNHGLSRDHPPLTHADWLGLIHPDDLERLTVLLRESLEQTHIWDAEFRVVWPDRTIHWLLAKGQVYLDDSGRPVRLAGVSLDITERKHAEAALMESEGRFRNMADTAPVMMWVADADKRCTFFSKGWLTFTGRTMDQELGNGWAEGVHPDDLDRCFATYSSSFDARCNFQMEYRMRRADGEYRWLLDNGAPRFETSGGFAGYIGSCIDITDLKRAQEEALARQKLESLGVLASGIAHDFNNLLGGILTSTEVALSELTEGSSVEEELHSIKATAIRGAEIVRQLMLHAGNESPAFELLDVSVLVHEMLQLLKVSITKHATLSTDFPRDLPVVQANPAQLRQVVMNLVINASEAIGEREGEIHITTALVTASHAASVAGLGSLLEGDYVQLEVSDTGRGMTPEVQARIFDPFFSTKQAGRGLGLAAIQGIIHSHRGALNVVSASGQGTKFAILLPCSNRQLTSDM